MSPVFRFAPSPNGYLHAGHAYCALLNAEMARESRGRFLLRIEDIDKARCRQDYEQAIFEDLRWLGLTWEEPVRRQSEHFQDYAASLSKLQARTLVYPCFCSRGDILRAVAGKPGWPRDPDGAPLYPGTCRGLSEAERLARMAREPFALRLDMRAALAAIGPALTWTEWDNEGARTIEAMPSRWGDVILARKDIGTSYHIAVVTDDALQGVTHVVRGRDLFEATSVHRVLQTLLGLPEPVYRHHALIRDAFGDKLAKTRGSTPLRDLRAQGVEAEHLRLLLLGMEER